MKPYLHLIGASKDLATVTMTLVPNTWRKKKTDVTTAAWKQLTTILGFIKVPLQLFRRKIQHLKPELQQLITLVIQYSIILASNQVMG